MAPRRIVIRGGRTTPLDANCRRTKVSWAAAVLEERAQLAARRVDFAIETTLNALNYVRRIRAWNRAGYRIETIYLKLQSCSQVTGEFPE